MATRFEAIAGSAIGYTTGSGASVTQETDKTTAVTINAPCGLITSANSPLTAGQNNSFQVNNSFMSANDVVIVNHGVGTGANDNAYYVHANTFADGRFRISILSISAATKRDAVDISFVILKAARD